MQGRFTPSFEPDRESDVAVGLGVRGEFPHTLATCADGGEASHALKMSPYTSLGGTHMNAATARKAKHPHAPDAIALLKADHRQVEKWFEEFEGARSSKVKQVLATQICSALRVHCEIEEEIF